METPLDLLMKATHYVENQQQSNNLNNANGPSNSNAVTNEDKPIKENGHADRIASPYRKTTTPVQEAVSQHYLNKQHNPARRTSAQDESGIDRKRESNMRYTDVSSSDEATANMSQISRNGILQQMYGVEDKIPSAYRATDSPLKSSPRKRSSSPSSRVDSEQPAKMQVPPQFNPLIAAATPSVGHQLSAGNPVIPFIHPLYSGLDTSLYADALARQTLANSDAIRSGGSPASTSTTQAANDAITSQGLSRLMYPMQNPALLMAQRAPTASGLALPEIPMVVPSQFAAAYGQTTGLLPQQLAAWSAASEADKRMMESMAAAAGLSTQNMPAQWLANYPYLKNAFAAASSDLASNKDTNRNAQKASVPPAVGLTQIPQNYTAEFLLKYPEALHAELLKQHERTLASQSMSPAPETIKKPGISAHLPSVSLPLPQDALAASSLTKPSIMDWKVPATAARALKHEGGQSSFEVRPPIATTRRDGTFNENHASQAKVEEARHKLAAGLAQRPSSGSDGYVARYNSHDRQSTSPFTSERWDYRRRSRDFSPHLSPNSSDKSAKKRPAEMFGIPRDLIPPELKNHSPSTQSSIGGLRQSKSPQRATRSPLDHPVAPSVASGLFASLAGKANAVAGDKDNAVLYPYMLHPALSGYPLPLALPATSYLCQPDISTPGSTKAMADALTAAAQVNAAAVGSHLLRAQLPQESALTAADLARWPGISPYIPLLQHSHLQALKAFSPSSTATADYATAVKLAQQNLLDGRDKERVSSPSHPSLVSARRFMPNPNMSPAPKVARASPVLMQNKTNVKNPTQALNHLYKPRSTSPVRGPEALDGRLFKRETNSPGAKRTLPSSISPHGNPRSTSSSVRLTEEERSRLKRKPAEDLNEKNFAKEVSKRKRELTAANDVDEHFRRSLGSDYKESDGQNKVHITGSVDDHFQKALGNDVWSKLKPTKAYPPVTDPLTNGRDVRSIPSGLHSGLPPYPVYLTSMHGAPPDSRTLTSLSYSGHPMMNMAGGRTVKSGGTVYPEINTDTSLPSTKGHVEMRGDTQKRHPAFSESRPLPPAYDAVARRQNDTQEPAVRRASSSPNEKAKKPSFSQNSSPRSNSSQNSNDRPSLPTSENALPVLPPAKSVHTITNGFSKSPPKPLPPPAYTPPSSSNSISAVPVSTPPTHPMTVDRQPSEEGSKSTPAMSVQSSQSYFSPTSSLRPI